MESYSICSKKKVCVLYGKWTECMYTVDPAIFEAHKKNDKVTERKKSSKEVCFSCLLVLWLGFKFSRHNSNFWPKIYFLVYMIVFSVATFTTCRLKEKKRLLNGTTPIIAKLL